MAGFGRRRGSTLALLALGLGGAALLLVLLDIGSDSLGLDLLGNLR